MLKWSGGVNIMSVEDNSESWFHTVKVQQIVNKFEQMSNVIACQQSTTSQHIYFPDLSLMGRPKLYNTPEEHRDTKWMHRRSHYARYITTRAQRSAHSCNQHILQHRNKAVISLRRKEKYWSQLGQHRPNVTGILPCSVMSFSSSLTQYVII